MTCCFPPPSVVEPGETEVLRPMIYRDSREKAGKGWFFPPDSYFAGTTVKCLRTGDYALEHHEHRLCLDRKSCCSEMAQNLVSDRFERELARMAEFDRRLIIAEFPEREITEDWPRSSGLPPRKLKLIRTSARFLKRRMAELSKRHSVEFLFFPGPQEARDYVYGLFVDLMNPSPSPSELLLVA